MNFKALTDIVFPSCMLGTLFKRILFILHSLFIISTYIDPTSGHIPPQRFAKQTGPPPHLSLSRDLNKVAAPSFWPTEAASSALQTLLEKF